MLVINKDKGEIVYSYESTKGLVQGRLTYHKADGTQLAFTMTGRTVPHYGDICDIGTMLAALGTDLVVESLGTDLVVESRKSESDGSLTADEAPKTEP